MQVTRFVKRTQAPYHVLSWQQHKPSTCLPGHQVKRWHIWSRHWKKMQAISWCCHDFGDWTGSLKASPSCDLWTLCDLWTPVSSNKGAWQACGNFKFFILFTLFSVSTSSKQPIWNRDRVFSEKGCSGYGEKWQVKEEREEMPRGKGGRIACVVISSGGFESAVRTKLWVPSWRG